MSTLTNLLVSSPSTGYVRPFDVRRDLLPVADLVEQCFADTLDPDGERYLQQMRSAAHNPGFLRWAAMASEWASVPLSGYVWEENGRLIGNASLIPYMMSGRRRFLIANVAVHPDYRRRGVARSLTVKAMDHALRRGAQSIWLHVRENNDPAVNLYLSLGFVERARRTTWYSTREIPYGASTPGVVLRPRPPRHWDAQRAWLKQTYPPDLTWHLPLNLNALRPGLLGALQRLLSSTYIYQWSAQRNDHLLGVLTWQSNSTNANNLWLAAAPGSDELAAHALLLHARQNLSPRRQMILDYPAHQCSEVIQAAGFYAHQTLIWMEVSFRPG